MGVCPKIVYDEGDVLQYKDVCMYVVLFVGLRLDENCSYFRIE